MEEETVLSVARVSPPWQLGDMRIAIADFFFERSSLQDQSLISGLLIWLEHVLLVFGILDM